MSKVNQVIIGIFCLIIVLVSCSKSDVTLVQTMNSTATGNTTPAVLYAAIKAAFGTSIDPANLIDYANQSKPNYINKDNSGANGITNAKATLGRVLFYDNNLSVNNTISCSSCHKQEFAFSDTALVSSGVLGGVTARHSIRLINTRFAMENNFFWDERASSLENQTTQPIVDHNEMGFSGQSGRGDIKTLLTKLQAIGYYKELFNFVYKDTIVTEQRLQECLAQFVRSIQSFDSKYDVGRSLALNEVQNFTNFSTVENDGKNLFMTNPVFDANSIRIAGGLGCNRCHNAPEFDIDPNSKNNGVIAVANSNALDITVTRSPTLRDLVTANGILNGRLMHSGGVRDLATAISHYGGFINDNRNVDNRLKPNGKDVQRLNLQQSEITAVVAFLKTLAGTKVYTDTKWASPFKN